jgi:hypothetical protein
MTDTSYIQRIQEIDRERASLFEQAKDETLRRAHQAIENLNAIRLLPQAPQELVAARPPGFSGCGPKLYAFRAPDRGH